MGFYFEMQPAGDREFKEASAPPVFWTLYAILGFALACMSGAAFTILRGMAAKGDALDVALYYMFLSTLPLFLLLGVRLLWVRKFIALGDKTIQWGYRLGGWTLFKKTLSRDRVKQVLFLSRVPTPNMAPQIHDDQQYYFQGHWRLVLRLDSGKDVRLDRHNERAALEELFEWVSSWLGRSADASA
ncbi:MAG: hypothetical protein H6617_00515 [Bdellovibrionaceae bacterium]|nr:hypothetical protein [Bdellovibrionales bacterium]MCB9253150.1 hypothetical protein [Pseudobdellovibrionaceae bacterium]